MPVIDITEYAEQPRDANGSSLLTGREPAITNQQVTVGGGSLPSSAFSAETRFVRVHSDTTCRIAFGAAPTASAASMRLASNVSEFFGVRPGDKLAVIQSS